MIPRPTDVHSIEPITAALDAADHAERLRWVRSLRRRQQRRLFELAKGHPIHAADLAGSRAPYTRHLGRNTLPLFSRFEKRLTRLNGAIAGYNRSGAPGPLGRAADWFTGPGYFVAYDSPEVPGEVWIDYRTVPPGSVVGGPRVRDNERGLPALVFGDLVDVVRRVSKDVVVGDAFKARYPRPRPARWIARIGARLPTAMFVMCQEPPS
jgi:hypothetical protein